MQKSDKNVLQNREKNATNRYLNRQIFDTFFVFFQLCSHVLQKTREKNVQKSENRVFGNVTKK